MVKLQTKTGGLHRLLLNYNGRLSYCLCCCEDQLEGRSLYLHIQPVLDDENCNDIDFGTEPPSTVMPPIFGQDEKQGAHCEDWVMNEDENAFELGCTDPTLGSQLLFGVAAWLYCSPTNEFFLDFCWKLDEQPLGFPDDTSDCDEVFTGLEPISEYTCEAPPMEFKLEFPNLNFNGQCLCEFAIWIDEIPDQVETINPFYFPAEGGRVWGQDLTGTLWFFESVDIIGTPLHLQKVPNLVVPVSTSKFYTEFPEELNEFFSPS